MNNGWQLGLLAVSIFAGVVYPPLAAFFKPFLLPLIFLLFLSAVLQVSFGDAIDAALTDKAAWITLIWQFLILPLVFFVGLKPLLPEQLHLFAVVSMCTGAITATTALSRLFALNSALSLVVCMAGAVLMPLPLYLFLTVLVDATVQLDLIAYVVRIFVFIVLPFVVAFCIRKLITAETDARLQQRMPQFALLLLVFFGLAVMDGVGALMLNDPYRLLSFVLLAFAISIGVQLLSYLALGFLGEANAKTIALLSAYRNMGLVAAIAGPALGQEFFIFLGVWQLPMYVLPYLSRKFYQTPKDSLA